MAAAPKALTSPGEPTNMIRTATLPTVLATLALSLSLAGCAVDAGDSTATDDEEATGTAEQELNQGWNLANGLYRVNGAPEVYMILGSSYCHVYDPGQINALARHHGWGTDVFNLGALGNLSWRTFTGSCKYPDGMYRRQVETPVYLVTGNQYCWVKNATQVANHGGWGAVLVINRPVSHIKFQDGRTYTGHCAW